MNAWVDSALAPCDALRRQVLRSLVAQPTLRNVVVQRERRVPIVLMVCAATSFALALFAPLLLLVWSPLILGVPHLAADVRYLVLRRELTGSERALHLVFAVGLVLLALAPLHANDANTECYAGCAWLVCGAGFGCLASRRRAYAAAAMLATALVCVMVVVSPRAFQLALMHGHNLLALAIWLGLWSRRHARLTWLYVLGVVVATTVLALAQPDVAAAGLTLGDEARRLAPGLGEHAGRAFARSFAFLQSLHYTLWLFAIPQQDGRAAGSATFRTSFRELLRDFGGLGLLAIMLLALLWPSMGLFDSLRARHVYFAASNFHAWLELAALASFAARGRRLVAHG